MAASLIIKSPHRPGFKNRLTVARWIGGSSLAPRFSCSKHSLCTGFFNNSLCSPSSRMVPDLGKMKGGEEEEWRSHLSYTNARNTPGTGQGTCGAPAPLLTAASSWRYKEEEE